MMARFKRAGQFGKDRNGNVALAFALGLVPMAGAAGVAVDIGVASNVRAALQIEADAAALEVMKAAVEAWTSPANATKTPLERQAMIDARASQIMEARQSIARSRFPTDRVTDVSFMGQWSNALKTEYSFQASAKVKRYIKLAGIGGSGDPTPVGIVATAKMDVQTSSTTSVPKLANPGYEAGDYNRIYAYCYDDSKKNETSKGRSQMTPVSSNGTHGNSNTPELNTNNAFKDIKMPVCGANEVLSWRLYNVRGQRTNPNSWPQDKLDKDTGLWEQTDKTGVTIYNHFSDTKIDAVSGLEEYGFRGDAFGYNAPIKMMETVVCDTMDKCTPGKPGAVTPKGKNRNPVSQNIACSPGKFMYIGWEDRPFLPKNAALNDYSSNNSQQWTDSDYDDITLVISCPEQSILEYKTKIWLSK